MGRRLTKIRPRVADPGRVLSDLSLMEGAGLRAAVELRGLDEHQLADMLCDVIEQVRAIRSSTEARAAVRVRDLAQSGEER